MIIKLPKRPDSIFNNEHLFNYLLDLERKQKLDILPANLMVYYVFSTFVNEVLNGGLVHYFTNSSKLTYIHLRQCAILLNHEAFTPYVLEVCDYVDSIPHISFLTDNKKYENIDYYMVHNTHYGQSTTAGACTILSKL